MSEVLLGLLFVVAIIGCLVLVPGIAQRNGYSFWGFFVLSLVAWPAALVLVLVLPPRFESVSAGMIVRVREPVSLNDGGVLKKGHEAKVVDVDVIDGHFVVQLPDAAGRLHWIARSNVLPI